MAAPRFIFHIAFAKNWNAQIDEPEYLSDSLEHEGFIHCSKLEQLPNTLKRFFKGKKDIQILKIDTTLVNVPLIYEAADDGSGFFPHLFGGILKQAIVEVWDAPFEALNLSGKK